MARVVLTEQATFELPDGPGLWLGAADALLATGWEAKPEGMCRGDVCVPLPEAARHDGAVDVAAFWRLLGAPVVSEGNAWALTAAAGERNAALASLEAPDFALPDLAGRPHRLSELRGQKVFLTTWASWRGCRFDLPVWQQLYASLADAGFMVVAVAEESRGADGARPWIEQAAPDYWALIDTQHVVAALYGMVNVPQAVWIDEGGRIVRGPETAGSTDHFRRMDRAARVMSPEDQAARLAAREAYMDAVREWVRSGRHARPEDAARQALPAITPSMAEADAHFRLGLWLRGQGKVAEAARHLADAARLHPASWNIWRQGADLGAIDNAGGAAFWARVDALGDAPYYPPPDLPGFHPEAGRRD